MEERDSGRGKLQIKAIIYILSEIWKDNSNHKIRINIIVKNLKEKMHLKILKLNFKVKETKNSIE